MPRDPRGSVSPCCPATTLTLPMLAVGGRGVISVTSNLAPREVGDVVRKFQGGDPRARALHRLAPAHQSMFRDEPRCHVALRARGRIARGSGCFVWPSAQTEEKVCTLAARPGSPDEHARCSPWRSGSNGAGGLFPGAATEPTVGSWSRLARGPSGNGDASVRRVSRSTVPMPVARADVMISAPWAVASLRQHASGSVDRW